MSSAANLYHPVIADVVNSVRDAFLDEGVDEQVLQELKQLWTAKLEASKTINPVSARGVHQEAALDSKAAVGRARPAAMASTSRASGPVGVAGAGLAGPTATLPAAAAGAAAGGAPGAGNQLVITDPNRLVPVQITIPAQPGNPASQPRALTVQVPAHALQQSGTTAALLQSVLTQAITQALTLPESHAAVFLQQQIDTAFKLSSSS